MAGKTYAWINNGSVGQIISTDVDISTLYAPGFVASCVDVTNVSPIPAEGDIAAQTNGTWLFSAPEVPTLTLVQQAQNAKAWIQQQANLAAAMGEVFTADMKAYVKAITAIASGTDTTSTALPAQPADVMAAASA